MAPVRTSVDVAAFRRVVVSMELRVRNTAVNTNCTTCVDSDIVPCSAASASSRHVLSANNYITESGKCDVICMRFRLLVFRHCLKSVE